MTRGRAMVDSSPRAPQLTRPAVGVIALVLALLAAWLAPVAGLAPAAPVLAAATDLTLVTDTVYTVQPDRNRVRVSLSIVARNNTKETRTKKFWFTHAYLAVQPTASDLKVTGAKGASVRVSKRTADATLLRINFGSRLYSGRSRTFKLTFSLVDKGKPSDRTIRVGTSLVTLPVWAHASNGASGGSVKVRIPAGYDVSVEQGTFARRTTLDDGGTELATGKLRNPLSFFAYVTAQRPAVPEDTPLAVAAGDERIALTLRGWQGDTAWSTRIGDLFRRSLPVLREDIGLPWPHDEPMVVQEAISRAADGYAGLFDPAENRIEVAYWADHQVVIHEAAHGWFNGGLLADRWANEGFASLYAARAAEAIGEEGAGPELTEELAAAAIPLNAWSATPPQDAGDPTDAGPSDAAEAYGYAASLALATAIAERAGDDALRGVWADAASGIGAYQPQAGDPPAAAAAASEAVGGPPDWRGLLDLIEARTGGDFTDLWREWVVRPEEAALLDARAEARRSYARTIALAGDWSLPGSIRDALRAWQFDTAEQLLADARTVLAQRSAVESMAEQDGVTLPADMQALFESGDLVGASGRAEAERNAMLAITQAAAARSSSEDPLTTVGMLGEDPDAELIAARAALADGDLEATFAFADDAYRAWTGAWQEGRRRALLGLAVLATFVVLASAVAGKIRRDRRQHPALASVAVAAPAFAPEPTPEELLEAAVPYTGPGIVVPPARPDEPASV